MEKYRYYPGKSPLKGNMNAAPPSEASYRPCSKGQRSADRSRTSCRNVESRLKLNNRGQALRASEVPITFGGPVPNGKKLANVCSHHVGTVECGQRPADRSRSVDSRLKMRSEYQSLCGVCQPMTCCHLDRNVESGVRSTGRSRSVDSRLKMQYECQPLCGVCQPMMCWRPVISRRMVNGEMICETAYVLQLVCCAVDRPGLPLNYEAYACTQERTTEPPPPPTRIAVGERDDGLVSSYTGHIPGLQYALGETYGTACKRIGAERLLEETKQCC